MKYGGVSCGCHSQYSNVCCVAMAEQVKEIPYEKQLEVVWIEKKDCSSLGRGSGDWIAAKGYVIDEDSKPVQESIVDLKGKEGTY